MELPNNADDKVLKLIAKLPGSLLDDIVCKCSDLTWNQVFIVIDRLSRAGAIKLTPNGRGLYLVHPRGDGSNINNTDCKPARHT